MTDRELLEKAAKAAGIDVPKKLNSWLTYGSNNRGRTNRRGDWRTFANHSRHESHSRFCQRPKD